MRNIIKILFFIMLIFFINLFFYFTSSDYRFFLKKLKDKDNVVYLEEKNIDDSFSLGEDISNESIVKIDNKDKQAEKQTPVEQTVILGKNYMSLVEMLADYDLQYLEINANLFDITDEYPDKYYEYYSSDVTLYLFTTKSYEEVKDVFEVLEYELPFTINQVNNFGEKSFYVNLADDITDKYVRLVVSHKGIAFGLKIKKDEYNSVKGLLMKHLQ